MKIWRRVHTIMLFLSLALWSVESLALGLGALRLHSTLTQPFVGSVEIVDVPSENALREWQVDIMPPVDGALEGDRRVVDKLSAFLESTGLGARVVLRSDEAIFEPLFQIRLRLRRDNEQIVRDYRVFLDLPGEKAPPPLEPLAPAALQLKPQSQELPPAPLSVAPAAAEPAPASVLQPVEPAPAVPVEPAAVQVDSTEKAAVPSLVQPRAVPPSAPLPMPVHADTAKPEQPVASSFAYWLVIGIILAGLVGVILLLRARLRQNIPWRFLD